MSTTFLLSRPYFWYVDHISGMSTILLVFWPYFWCVAHFSGTYVDHNSGMLTLSLVFWPYFWYVDHISGMLTVFLVLWPYFWYIDHIAGILTLSLVLVLVLHSRSLIGSDMPSALSLVPNVYIFCHNSATLSTFSTSGRLLQSWSRRGVMWNR